MELKTFKIIKIISAVVLGVAFSRAFILGEFVIPIVLAIIIPPILFLLSKKVKGVIADERDYETMGRASYLSMKIYSWLAVVMIVALYAFKDSNPAFEAVAFSLAFSTCFLIILSSLIFEYHNKFKFTDRKFIFVGIILIFFVIVGILGIRFFSGEDNWICKNGKWIKHGNPSAQMPTIKCE